MIYYLYYYYYLLGRAFAGVAVSLVIAWENNGLLNRLTIGLGGSVLLSI